MALIKHIGIVRNGQITFYNPDLRINVLAELEGKEVEEIIKEKPKKSSTDQYGYYFGGVIGECKKVEKFGGWEEKEIDEFFCDKFLSYPKMIKVSDTSYKEVIRTQSKATLSKKELAEFIDKVISWCATEGIYIRTPEEYYLGKYKTI
jgi:hypothetical protein